MRVAIYARVSWNPTAKKVGREEELKKRGQDYENQLSQLKEYIRNNKGWELVKEYIDEKTGKNSDREQFQQMFKDASQKKFDLLLFWSLDRLSREGVAETLAHLQRLTSYGVEWWSYTEEYLRSIGIFRDAIIAILATIAKQERIRIVERTLAGLDRARKEGTKSGKAIGRPKTVIDKLVVKELREKGIAVTEIAKKYGTTIHTIYRLIKKDKPSAIRIEI